MDDPTARNRLDAEASPYLRQHADNPVNWQPWDDDALEAARERERPIFLSVGYAACHWCHVMEEESFEDEAVAAILNGAFVPIKVDREERPDVDRVYQTACQLLAGRGGWPLSAWLTPDGKPFRVGTYFPREPRRGMPGFLDLLEDVATAWDDPEDRAELEERAETITSRLRAELEDVPDAANVGEATTAPPEDIEDVGERPEPDERGPGPLERAASAAVNAADRQHGGWGRGPKFPQPARIEALFEASLTDASGSGGVDGEGTTGDGDAAQRFQAVGTAALAAMTDGGLYDHVGGGFHRYCTDRDWTVPHFEKMLYDNAELPRQLLRAYQLTGRERYADVARETFAFLDRELSPHDGAFAATLDARSPVPPGRTEEGEPGEHEEGAFYVWTPGEVASALDDGDLASLVSERFGITTAGNFEGKTVLTVDASLQALADDRDLDPATVAEQLDAATEGLRAVREQRPRPRRDDKVIAGWNGLAIRALAEGSLVLEEDALADRALGALAAVREQLWDGERLARRYVPGSGDGWGAASPGAGDGTHADVQGRGYLEDYAFLGRGALACYETTGDVDALGFALDLGDVVVEQFYDDAAGTLYATPADGEDLIARPQEPRDQSTPSSLGVGTDLLLALDAFRSDDRFETAARHVLETHRRTVEKHPLEHPSLALAAERARSGSTEVTIALEGGRFGEETAERWRSWLADRALPRRLVAPRPADDALLESWLEDLGLDDAPPIWAGRGADTPPRAYVCQGFTCSRPLADTSAADDWLAG